MLFLGNFMEWLLKRLFETGSIEVSHFRSVLDSDPYIREDEKEQGECETAAFRRLPICFVDLLHLSHLLVSPVGALQAREIPQEVLSDIILKIKEWIVSLGAPTCVLAFLVRLRRVLLLWILQIVIVL